ncbi:MAG: phosphate acetyltransferase [Flammeovirgaceae bacterium]
MANSIFLASTEANAGKSLVSLGIMEIILRKTKKVGVFRPLISRRSDGKQDEHIALLIKHFNLTQSYQEAYAYYESEAYDLVNQGKTTEVIETIIHKYKALEEKCDFVLCEDSDMEGETAALEFNLNLEIAKNLACPVMIVGSSGNKSPKEAVRGVKTALEAYLAKDCQVIGAIINKVSPEQNSEVLKLLRESIPHQDRVLGTIPTNELLASPTAKEVAEHLNAKVLYGADQLEKQIFRYSIAAMQLQNYLPHITDNCLVITPSDRGDIILAVLQAHQSRNYPSISAFVLTGGFPLPESIVKLLDGLPNIIPIMTVQTNTFITASNINNIRPKLTADKHNKITLALQLFEKQIDTKTLEEKIVKFKPTGMTPKMFEYKLVQMAKRQRRHIVLPEGTDERILRAAEILSERDIVDLTILGEPEEVKSLARKLSLNIDWNKIPIINPTKSSRYLDYVQTLYELRKNKGVNLEIAKDLMSDVSYYGTMMVYLGDAHGMVSGAMHTTQHTIRPALQFIKTKPGISVVSSVFFMCLEDRVIVYGDCAVNPNPSAEELAEIAISSADSAVKFGIEPRVAMLSYSSGESGKGEEVEKVRKATQIAKEKRPDLLIEGPIQYDAAVDMEVGKKKMPNSQVAGQATVLIFPDLNTGNNTYKAVQRETGAIAIGPVLQGLNKPVNDLSRGCLVADVVNTVIITAIQGQTV